MNKYEFLKLKLDALIEEIESLKCNSCGKPHGEHDFGGLTGKPVESWSLNDKNQREVWCQGFKHEEEI